MNYETINTIDILKSYDEKFKKIRSQKNQLEIIQDSIKNLEKRIEKREAFLLENSPYDDGLDAEIDEVFAEDDELMDLHGELSDEISLMEEMEGGIDE